MNAENNPPELVYDIHVFCCINERESGHPRGSCAARGAVELHKHMKARSKQLQGPRIRINKAGCLDRCELGPVLVVYPEATWYRFDTQADVDEIIDRHVMAGETVERLLLAADQKQPETKPDSRIRLKVERISRLTDGIKKFELAAADGGELPAFDAGSHIDIFTGGGLRRSYSLANSPEQRDRYEIAVLREPAGRGGSAWMHDALAFGDVIEATAPKNLFPLDESADSHLLIAGGIGITPLLSMGRRLRHLNRPATLHYCTRGPETTAYAKEVKDVFGDGVIFHHDGGDPSRGIDLKSVLADPQTGVGLYVCGPGPLIDAVREAAAHWPEGSVHFERFSAPVQDVANDEDEPFDIVLSRQGKTLTVPPGKSILEVVTEAGITVESACEEGICGCCEIRLLGGEADHRDSFLGDDDKQNNRAIMVCSSRARKGETLVLDL